MAETLILDPAVVADDRVELDLTALVGPDGPDFGDAAIEQHMAEGDYGQVPVDGIVPNRTVAIPLVLREVVGMTFIQARRAVQAKAALMQSEGEWVARESAEGVVYADVVSATLKLGAKNAAAFGFVDTDAVLTLECLPDWYGDEIALDAVAETVAPEIVTVLEEDGSPALIRGDIPGRCRIVVTDTQNVDRAALLWAFRSRFHDAAATAALALQAEAMTPIAPAAVEAISGAAGASGVRHASLGTAWAGVLATTLSGQELTHRGTYAVYARVRAPETLVGAPEVRLAWGVGDLTTPTINARWTVPAFSNFFIAPLGHITIARLGPTQQWVGQIEARAAADGGQVQIDRLWLVPVDERAGQVRAASGSLAAMPAALAKDQFAQTAGALHGKVAALGGTWATSGVATDFQVNATDKSAERTTIGESSALLSGRLAILGATSLAGVAAQVSVKTTGWASGASNRSSLGLVLRYVDASNFALARLATYSDRGVFAGAELIVVVAGSIVLHAKGGWLSYSTVLGNWMDLRCVVYPNGRTDAWIVAQGTEMGAPLLTTSHAALATGGALASGKFGLSDYWPSANAATRSFDDVHVAAITSSPDAALFAGRQTEIATDGAVRQNSTGTGTSRPWTVGDLPRIPPSGIEQRPVELLILPTRGDLGMVPDSGIDDITAQVHYRPSYLFLPEAP